MLGAASLAGHELHILVRRHTEGMPVPAGISPFDHDPGKPWGHGSQGPRSSTSTADGEEPDMHRMVLGRSELGVCPGGTLLWEPCSPVWGWACLRTLAAR